jgi:hypothetical protein
LHKKEHKKRKHNQWLPATHWNSKCPASQEAQETTWPHTTFWDQKRSLILYQYLKAKTTN